MMQEVDENLAARKRLPRLDVHGHHTNHNHLHTSDPTPTDETTTATHPSSTATANGDAVLSRRVHTPPTSDSPKFAFPMTTLGQIKQDHEKLLKHQDKSKTDPIEASSTDETSDAESDESHGGVHHDLSRWEQLERWLRKVRQTFGTPFLVLVSAVYAVQGFGSFSALAINYFFKDNLNLQPAESQALTTVMMFPWGVKPLYGIVSDSLPLFEYHRKSYMVLFSTLGALAYLLLSMPNAITTPFAAVLVFVVNNLSSAVIDVVIDARVVEMSRLDPKNGANDLQSISWTSMAIGGVVGSFLSGAATHALGVRGVFLFASIGPMAILVFSLRMREQKSRISARHCMASARRQFLQLKGAVLTPVIWKCALWVFLSGAISPGYSQVFFYFSTDVLEFTPEFLGTVSAFGFVFLLIGTLIYNTLFKDVSFRRIFLFAQLALAAVSMLDVVLVTRANLSLGIPDKAFVLGDAVIADVVSRLKTMPVLVLCAKLCPKGVEGTLFALLMSISNFSFSVSEFWGAFICHTLGIEKDAYSNLWIAIVLRSVLKLMPILFLFLIPTSDPQEIIDDLNFDRDDDDEDDHSGQIENGGDGAMMMTTTVTTGVVRDDHTVSGSSPETTPVQRVKSPATSTKMARRELDVVV